ncbi:Hypothetical predicted protein [Paramuricea clavata]|uniref:Uncharacterized protein n=1 Tax=Paramuricea clavata TaxID=317549 RepID=A0A6S7HBD0_PARCT|nr:Hypothetical predicted protein [Paramuricea clavata]
MNHQLVQGLYGMSMTQLVNFTTRPPSNTCLDHIWCTTEDNIVRISVPQIGLSDHFPVCFIRKFNGGLCKAKSHLTIKYRCFKMFDSAKFIKDLENVPWQELAAIDTDPDAALDTFERLFNNHINDHAPMKEKRVKLWRQPPWMKPEILSILKKRDRLLKEAINGSGKANRNTKEWRHYRKVRNEVVWLINRSKREFYRSSIEENEGHRGKMWNSTNGILKHDKKSSSPRSIK